MKLDTPHQRENVVTIGVVSVEGEKEISVSLDDTVLHLELNEAQAEYISEALSQ